MPETARKLIKDSNLNFKPKNDEESNADDLVNNEHIIDSNEKKAKKVSDSAHLNFNVGIF